MSYSRQSTAEQRADELKHKLDKLQSRQTPKNVFKKLPGYGSAWFYRKRSSPTPPQQSTSGLERTQVAAFVKKLRTRPPPDDFEEDMRDVIQGPGFEFPNDKEAAKSVKHWSKRFKQWQPTVPSVPSTPRPVLKIKPPSSNEIEIEGKRYRRVESMDERHSLFRNGVALMHPRRPTPSEARCFGELFKDDDVECRFVVAKDSGEEQLNEMLNHFAVKTIYAPATLATMIRSAIDKRMKDASATAKQSPVRSLQEKPSPRL